MNNNCSAIESFALLTAKFHMSNLINKVKSVSQDTQKLITELNEFFENFWPRCLILFKNESDQEPLAPFCKNLFKDLN